MIGFTLANCEQGKNQDKQWQQHSTNEVYIQVLGTVQDGGSPHAACTKSCCKDLFNNPIPKRMVVCLGLVDQENKMNWIFEASPDLSRQMKALNTNLEFEHSETPDGIFITHAHIGHYAGLMYLGREAMNAKDVAVYAMLRLKTFLESNGPWSQLVLLNNIHLNLLKADSECVLSNQVKVIPFLVPHRDEFSETIGYKICGPNKKLLFIPDIDKWEKWNKDIVEEIKKVDYALIDGTFYDEKEINNRNIKEIPHPFVIECMKCFEKLNDSERNKIHFIHFNHTNKLLLDESMEINEVLNHGYHVSQFNQRFEL